MISKIKLLLIFFFTVSVFANGQDTRGQYPPVLKKAFFELNLGYINYPFSANSLEPGYQVESIHVPHTAVRLVLFGYRFNKYLSAEINYMRPVKWVRYKNINGDMAQHSVWMNVAGLTAKAQLPVNKKFSFYTEGGLGIITRSGFKINDLPALKDASYSSILLGTGLRYHINEKWKLNAGITFSPENKKEKQPKTIFYSTGFTYQMNKISEEKIKEDAKTGFIFPKQMFQAGYTTNALGYGVNHFFANGVIPVFWGGDAEIKSGVTFNYQRNIFYTRRVFSFDWGASLGFYKSNLNQENIFTASLYPLLRFTALRTKPFDLYFNYSVAGPTYISKILIDSVETGRNFTFQDFMGMGIYAGKKRKLSAELRILHYSNGNIYPQNGGVKVPLTFNAGITF